MNVKTAILLGGRSCEKKHREGAGGGSNYFQFYVPKISLYKNYSIHFNPVFYQMGSVWEEATLVGWWLVAQNPK
jgi:hypothetical protein